MAGTCDCGIEPSGLHKMWDIALLDENLFASQDGFWSMEMSKLSVNEEVHLAVATVV